MLTCAGTGSKLHLIKPLGFSLDEKSIKRCGVNYIEHCDYIVYDNYSDFLSKNSGTFFYLTRYGKKTHSDFNFKEITDDIAAGRTEQLSGAGGETGKYRYARKTEQDVNGNAQSAELHAEHG